MSSPGQKAAKHFHASKGQQGMAFIKRPQSFSSGCCSFPPEGGDISDPKVSDYTHRACDNPGLQRGSISKTTPVLCGFTSF